MTRACATCQNTRKVDRPCDDPLCGDSTRDHACTAGSDPCPDCKSPPMEKKERLRLNLRALAAAITTAALVAFTKGGMTAALSQRHPGSQGPRPHRDGALAGTGEGVAKVKNHLDWDQEHQTVLWTPQMVAVVGPVACCLEHLPLGVYTDACDCCGTRVMLVNNEMPELDMPEVSLLCWSCALCPDDLVSTSEAATLEEEGVLVAQRSTARLAACRRRLVGLVPSPQSHLIT